MKYRAEVYASDYTGTMRIGFYVERKRDGGRRPGRIYPVELDFPIDVPAGARYLADFSMEREPCRPCGRRAVLAGGRLVDYVGGLIGEARLTLEPDDTWPELSVVMSPDYRREGV